MQYSDPTLATIGIIQREESLCRIGKGGISGDTVLLKQFTGYNNEAYHEVWMEILSVDHNAQGDDYNYTNYPDAPVTMVQGQKDYTIPVASVGASVATFLRLKGIYYLENGYRTYLTPMKEEETLTDIEGIPLTYKVMGKSIFFQCPFSAEALSRFGTFHVEYQRIPDAFLFDDTTQEPGFLSTYHHLIPLRASAKYLMPTDKNLATMYLNEFYAGLKMLKRDIVLLNDTQPKEITSEPVNPV